MKKLIVLLLAFAMVGAVSAQVTTAVSLSGSVYLWNKQSASADASTVSPNGASYDVLTIKGAGKDNKFGFELIDYDLLKTPAVVVDYWDIWYDTGMFKATLGKTEWRFLCSVFEQRLARQLGSYGQYFQQWRFA